MAVDATDAPSRRLTGLSKAVSLADEDGACRIRISLTELVAAARELPRLLSRPSSAPYGRYGSGWTHPRSCCSSASEPSSRRWSDVPPVQSVALVASGGLPRQPHQVYSYPLPFTADDLESWMRWATRAPSETCRRDSDIARRRARMAVSAASQGRLARDPAAWTEDVGRTPTAPIEKRPAAPMCRTADADDRERAADRRESSNRRNFGAMSRWRRKCRGACCRIGRPSARGSVLAALSLPARSVGGDYYDFLDLGDHRIGIALADIAGKGVAAALIMAVVQASLRIVASDGETSLPELAAKMNGFLHRSTGSNSYATFFYAQLDERSRQLRYVNAGHNPPYLLRAAAEHAGTPDSPPEIREFSIGGTVLGLFPQMTYEEATVDLQVRRRARGLHRWRHRSAEPRRGRVWRGAAEGSPARRRPPPRAGDFVAHFGTLRGWIKDTPSTTTSRSS